MSINAKSIQSFEYTQILQFLTTELKYDITTTNKIWIQLTGSYKSNSYGVIWIEGLMRYIDELIDTPLQSSWNTPMWHALDALHDELGQIDGNILVYYP